MDLIDKTKNHIRHFTVTGYVTNKSRTKLLMIHHKKLGKWIPPGGHLEANEVPHEGALREVFEETGVKAEVIAGKEPQLGLQGSVDTQIPAPYAITYQVIPANSKEEEHIHLDMLYHFEADETETVAELQEVHDAAWCTKEDILNNLDTFDAVRGFARLELRDN